MWTLNKIGLKRKLVIVIIAFSCFMVCAIQLHVRPNMYKYSVLQNVGKIFEIKNQQMDTNEDLLLIPTDEELKTLDEIKLKAIYWGTIMEYTGDRWIQLVQLQYINSLQTLCRKIFRIGSFKDGGKEICVDRDFRPVKPCLVYSFGSNWQFDFELSVKAIFGCEIHTFDPAMKIGKNWIAPGNVTFHRIGLSDTNHVAKNRWKMRTLAGVMKELDHENKTLDILKVDVEGFEWNSLIEASLAGTLRLVKQIAMETHYGGPGADKLRMLRYLYDNSFRICMRDRNLFGLRDFRTDFNTQWTGLNEITLINTRFNLPK